MNAQADCMLQDRKAQKCRSLTIGLSGEVYNQCCETLSYPICASVCYILSAGALSNPPMTQHWGTLGLLFIRKQKHWKYSKNQLQDKTRHLLS